ncbi:phage shock protein PspC (stress-responsive transcriptional regulator) [Allocatelliglobosispora scoriae]|uniref:Phage shock protein PspC (Stress-responsive transcriptional regulator) n=1 Tax=Allocatelliglobosispora scoriae TaxID=643052 RepID=A0A841BTN4_9ACTN|nr:PspC domain-containing protein [Allocatelliglobosispora scoriae]MBB5871564.1 phage shock protein PspC (stress-responsive transcriptional regulator) [Allocatelliglobosispora scoriae]
MTDNHDAPPPGATPTPEGTDAPTEAGSTAEPSPPTGGTPPPGAQAPPPSGAFAARYGLIRPRQPRVFAGVSGAIGRATNTDPILWRVLFIALAFFSGLGILLYLALWLGTPADGDSASPIESLFGRGRSSTSPVLTVIIGVIALIAFGGVTDNWHVAVIGALIVGLVVALSNRNRGGQVPVMEEQPVWTPPADGSEDPTAASASAGYRPPFAPHGPYAPAAPPPAVVLPLPPKEHSRLGSIVFSIGLLVIGVLGMIDLSNVASIPAGGYIAAGLITVGLGLVVGAFIGRARGLIALGIVLTVALAIVGPSGDWKRSRSAGGDVTWQPTSLSQLNDRYEHQFGQATLDLSELDFTGQDRDLTVQIEGGEFEIKLPDNVDVEAIANVKLGDVKLFDRDSSGVRVNDFTVTDLGEDGAGGGKLRITVNVTAGHAEVSR